MKKMRNCGFLSTFIAFRVIIALLVIKCKLAALKPILDHFKTKETYEI